MPSSRPTIAAHVGVKNEIGLIGPCIGHLRRLGVSEIVVHDVASTDGTREWLDAQPDLTVVETRDNDTDAAMEARTMAAVRGMAADWLLVLDADEFPLPKGGDLHACLARSSGDVLEIPRYNVVLAPEGMRIPLPPVPQDYDRIDLYVGVDKYYRKKLLADPLLTWLRYVPVPKIMVRLDRLRSGEITGFTHGLHGVHDAEGVTLAAAPATGIITAHAALSDYRRFAAKVDSIRALQDAGVATNYGWTWKRWAAQAEAGTLRGEFDRSVRSTAEIEALRREGVIRNAADLLSGAESL